MDDVYHTYWHKGYYCGKHKHYCVNVQALMDAKTDEIVYISKPLAGNTHDLKPLIHIRL